MIVKVIQDKDSIKYTDFYEGNHVAFSPKGMTWRNGLTVIVEGRKDFVTLEIDEESNTQIYLMNDQGKTVEKIFV